MQYLHKALPIFMLIGFVWFSLAGKFRLLLLGALAFSAAGDILLALPINNSFVFGLSAFFVAHVFYLFLICHYKKLTFAANKMTLSFVTYFIVMMAFVLPKTDTLLIPVLFYMLVIFAMAMSTLGLKNQNPLITLGALTFVVSDSIIAINKFVVTVPAEGLSIMTTYYLAQVLLVMGFVKGQKKARI
ncbi:lysoplasmalogenase [Psychrosphaera haliotis]|uniref:lysoplasmalogenase n=1 Tax=Psychrosphaera haliotis TaxID=555083 RepID=UPI0031DC3850